MTRRGWLSMAAVAGVFSFLVNHEFNSSVGIVRDHGSRGASVSLWKIKNDPAAGAPRIDPRRRRGHTEGPA